MTANTPTRFYRDVRRAGIWSQARAQLNPTPHTQLSINLSLTNWTFGFYAARYGWAGQLTLGIDLGPLEVYLMFGKNTAPIKKETQKP